MKRRAFPKFLALLLVALVALSSLTSCITINFLVPTKERVEKNVEANPEGVAGSVTDSLILWEVPRFFAPDLRELEAPILSRFAPDDKTVNDLAHKTVRLFLDEHYDVIDNASYSAVTVALYDCYLRACGETFSFPMPTADSLSAAMDGDGEFSHAAYYFLAWGFPLFDVYKLVTVETLLESRHFPELEEAKTLASRAVEEHGEELLSLDPTDKTAFSDALIRAYVLAIGDRYAIYRTAEEGEVFDEDMSGSYVGIGITVQYSYEDETILITSVVPGGPAEEAGLLPGDYLVAVDGKRASELGYNATVAAVRGMPETEVVITVLRGEEEIDFTVTRRQMTVETVTYELRPDGIAVIGITEFKANTGVQFIDAIRRAESDGAAAILFDVRSNPGGYLSAVCTALEHLVPKGTTLVSFNEEYNTAPILSETDHSLRVPVAVLCNGYTASAGELFTSALRDYSEMGLVDATVIGTTTYKKGIMQSGYVLSDGSTITFTVAQYNPPSGVNYDGIGITPVGENYVENTEGEDLQFARGIAVLTAKIAK